MKKIDEIREAMKKPPSKEDKDFFTQALKTMKYAAVMKRNMNKKGIKAAKAKCPYCDGYWHARISSYNGHMHMRCDGTCKAIMME
jgi:hypothetical protein